MKKLAIFFIGICIFSACRNEKNRDSSKNEITVDTLTYAYDSVKIYSKNVVKTDFKISDTTKAVITYPIFKNEILNNYILRQVFNYIGEEEKATSYKDIATSFVNGYDDFHAQNKTSAQTWWLTISVKLLRQTNNYIALQYINSDYSGGAHPNTSFSYLNYNTKTNSALTLDSLIATNQREKLVSVAEAIFRKDEKLTTTEPLSGKYFFSDDKFHLPENFYVSNKGLVFLYNPYEIKPYSEGITKLTIPFSTLKGIAKPNTILTETN
ncbi:DUF3298 and DUF4163 domain-containing protein [Pedobacter boryungensis]|uniref:DUF3298 domain-containing protein n=1 Tax=Pedobacter boryungensis TaxID=869962 RepID=A0ABX2D900_9SPHI|nr:DUF3298 and DUF4163 domain-containing protein [Pedobacter boryungensis]NQX30542.1 DUF3298 domain-containing protein [Pedobacter boryungensis]